MITGQRVVCIKSAKWQPVKEGLSYTVNGVMKCSCGTVAINVGFEQIKKNGIVECPKCGEWHDNKGLAWTYSSYFIPLDENWTDEVIASALRKQITEPLISIQ